MNKKSTLLIFLTSAIVGALMALALFFFSEKNLGGNDEIRPVTPATDPVKSDAGNEGGRQPVAPTPMMPTPEQINKKYGLDRMRDNPASIAKAMANLAFSADMQMLQAMVDQKIFTESVAQSLKEALTSKTFKVREDMPFSEVGEIRRPDKIRWAVNLEDGRRILIDMDKDENGKWTVTRVSLPTDESEGANNVFSPQADDALGVIDAFMRATIAQKFDVAKRFVDSKNVADATIAGICILFEEGHYGLREKMPIRNMFQSMNDEGVPYKSGYIAYVQASGEQKAGSIGIEMDKGDAGAWVISNLTLDSLLNDYATRFGGGDSLYIPLVKNPKGGDSLVLYFGFDEAVLTPRSVRQLEIVSQILKLDPEKKIEISGHTDDLGSDKYNQVLSEARANAVRQALISSGLAPDQVVTKGFGKKRQRREVDEEVTGAADAETIRRANRRAEIYLDF